jgi:hypothetical protein
MRYLWIIPAYVFLIVGAAACQPGESTPLVPGGLEPQTVTPGSTPESPPAQPSNPLLTPEDTDMPSPITPAPVSQ